MTYWCGEDVSDDIVLSTLVEGRHFVAVAELERERERARREPIDYEGGAAALRAAPVVPEPDHGPEIGNGPFR